MSQLFSPLSLRSVTLRNRVGVSPMCQYSCVDGVANDWHLVHLGAFATGGAGLVMTEAAAVAPEGRISPRDLGIWDDAQVPILRRLTDFLHAQGAVAGIQLAHAGRKASTRPPWEGGGRIAPGEGGWTNVVAPTALAFDSNYPEPRALGVEEMPGVVDAFRSATRRALEAGFGLIELHAAHGYLLHEFLSPLSNRRTDDYGGALPNRARLTLEVVDAVREAWPERLPLMVRISATDWAEGGWTLDESVQLARWLRERGVDIVDCSSGGLAAGVTIPLGPGYQIPFARRIRQDAGVPTAAVGMITEAEQAERVVAEGDADLVLMAREFLRQPHWPLLAAHTLGATVRWPVQYERARPR